jgi:hypothetical protein
MFPERIDDAVSVIRHHRQSRSTHLFEVNLSRSAIVLGEDNERLFDTERVKQVRKKAVTSHTLARDP